MACDDSTCYVATATSLIAMPFTGSDADPVPRTAMRTASDQPADYASAAANLRALGPGETQLVFAEGVAVARGEVYVCDRAHHRVVVYNAASLVPVRSFGAAWLPLPPMAPFPTPSAKMAWQPAELHSPEGIALLGAEAFVADSCFRRVAVFEPNRGTYLRRVGPFEQEVRGVVAVPAGASPLAHALLLVSSPTKVHVRLLHTGEPWQVVAIVGGGGLCWSPHEGKAYLMTDARNAGKGQFHVLRLQRLAEKRDRGGV